MSTYKYGQLVITLKSDLCVGSGYSYAGIVDSDTCYDEYGIPYIPGRRIKGCMREATESILHGVYTDDEIEEVFGSKGNDHGSDLLIDNAYIRDYDSIRDYLAGHKVCTAQEILDRYTHITGQTKLEEGVADPGSLRFTRSANHYDPMDIENNDPHELEFISDFTCDAGSWDMIRKAAMATRHIGLKRTRGLGNVRIEVKEGDMVQTSQASFIKSTDAADGKVTLSYAVRNIQPLMLSRTVEDESVDYIPGQQVIGLLAGRYLKGMGRSAEDKAFKELFLDGHSVFSNLYPYDGEHIYYPAADYLNRLKKTKKIVYNIASELPSEEEIGKESSYWYGDGNQPKKLKGKFVAWTGADSVAVCEVKKDVIYHHSHRNTHEIEGGKEEGILYSMEVIRRGQMFAGSITVPSEYADIIKGLLLDGELSFGKSRTAQYGKCRLIECRVEDPSRIQYGAGRDIVVTFQSDAIIQNKEGLSTVYYDEVCSAVASMLGIEDQSSEGYVCSLQTTTATGYMGTWNLRRPAIPAIKAGSYLVYHLSNAAKCDKDYIGERTLEGYGLIRIDYADGCKYDSIKNDSTTSCEYKGAVDVSDEAVRARVNRLVEPIVYDNWLNRKINVVITGANSVNVSNTSAGRFTLMLRESVVEIEEEKGSGHEADILNEFEKRIGSIKTDSTRKEGERLIKLVKGTFLSEEDNATELLKKDLAKLGEDLKRDELMKRWPQYMMAILTDRKYKGEVK